MIGAFAVSREVFRQPLLVEAPNIQGLLQKSPRAFLPPAANKKNQSCTVSVALALALAALALALGTILLLGYRVGAG